jgi:hypothetical protein
MNTVTIDSPTTSDSLMGDMGDVKPSIAQPSAAVHNHNHNPKKPASLSAAPSSSTKKASFECTSCTRKFSTRSHLVRHSRVHTGERKYACDYPGCEMRCSRKDNLQQQSVLFLILFSLPLDAWHAHEDPARLLACLPLLPLFFFFLSLCARLDLLDRPRHTSGTPAGTQPRRVVPTFLVPTLALALAHHSSSSYRTHLVVNPRRANAGQTLNLATDLVNSASSTLNPPLSVVPHHDTEPQVHHTPISPNPPSAHPEYVAQIHHIDSTNPYRAGSMSPPPLGNAWDYWYQHGCLPGSGSGPSASSSGSGSSGATSPELQSNALELVPGQRPPHPHHHHHHHHQHHHHQQQQQQQQQQHPHPHPYYPGPDGTALVQNHPFVPSDRRPPVDELSPPPTRHGHATGAYSTYPGQEGYTYSQNE